MPPRIALLTAVLVFANVTLAQSPPKYVESYQTLMSKVRQRMRDRALPASANNASAARPQMIAKLMDKIALEMEGYRKQLLAMGTPPRAYKEVHARTLTYFETAARGQRNVANAFRSGDTKRVQKASQQNDTSERLALQRMREALHKAGADISKLP